MEYPVTVFRFLYASYNLVSFPDRLSSAHIAFSITRAILKAIRAGVGWVWDRDYSYNPSSCLWQLDVPYSDCRCYKY